MSRALTIGVRIGTVFFPAVILSFNSIINQRLNSTVSFFPYHTVPLKSSTTHWVKIVSGSNGVIQTAQENAVQEMLSA